MSEPPNLKKAPIIEAVIDLRVELPEGVTFDSLQELRQKFEGEFPEVQQRNLAQTEIHIEKGEIAETGTETSPFALNFTSKSGQKIIQTQLSGFTFSWLKPYKDWEGFFGEAKNAWEIYSRHLKPISISRIGTRFIKRLELPLPIRDFKDFLTSVPEIPPRLPQNLLSFFSRVVIPATKTGSIAVITQASQEMMQREEKPILPVLLDIDVFREGPFEPDGKKAWELLNEFRQEKNRIFFQSITEELEERYR